MTGDRTTDTSSVAVPSLRSPGEGHSGAGHHYDSPVWNVGLLAVASSIHLVLARYESYPLDTRYRIGGRTESENPPS